MRIGGVSRIHCQIILPLFLKNKINVCLCKNSEALDHLQCTLQRLAGWVDATACACKLGGYCERSRTMRTRSIEEPVDCSRTIVLCSQNRGGTEKETDTGDAFSNDDDVSRSDNGIIRHFKESAECWGKVCPDIVQAVHWFVSRYTPALCFLQWVEKNCFDYELSETDAFFFFFLFISLALPLAVKQYSNSIDEFRMVWVASQRHVYLQQNSRKTIFFTLPVVNDNEIVQTTSDGVEGIQV